MAQPIRHVRGHLRRSDPVAALLDAIERRERLLSTVHAALPAALARHCRQAALDQDRLTLIVDSPAWVDRLRFLSPQVVDALTTLGVPVRDCQVRVVPGHRPADEEPAAGSGHRSAVATQCLEQAATGLGDGPLAASLRRLAHTLDPAQPTASGSA